jgi:hypothetical protein
MVAGLGVDERDIYPYHKSALLRFTEAGKGIRLFGMRTTAAFASLLFGLPVISHALTWPEVR